MLLHVQVCGVKGPSWLSILPGYDVVDGMTVDYMHCVLLGVCRQLFRLWIPARDRNELWYIGSKVQDIDKCLCIIKPPSEIQRTPRDVETTLKFWKGQYDSVQKVLIDIYICNVCIYVRLRTGTVITV